MKKTLFLFSLAIFLLLGCQPTINVTRSNPSNPSSTTSGTRRTAVASVEETDAPPIPVTIESEPGETSDDPADEEPATPGTRETTRVPSAAITAPLVGTNTPFPTTVVVRPLLPTTDPTNQESGADEPLQGSIGTPVEIGGLSIVVNSIESSPGREGDVPSPGTEFLIVSLTAENLGDGKLTLDASQFSLRAIDGNIILYEDVTFQPNLLRTMNLEPNARQDLFLVYQIAAGSTGYTLVLGDPVTGGVVNVRLN